MENKKVKVGSSLASLAAKSQEKNTTVVSSTSNVLSLDIDKISGIAKEIAARKDKLVAVYVSEDTKKGLEKLRLLDEFNKTPLASIATAVLNEFLSMNETEIRERLHKML